LTPVKGAQKKKEEKTISDLNQTCSGEEGEIVGQTLGERRRTPPTKLRENIKKRKGNR